MGSAQIVEARYRSSDKVLAPGAFISQVPDFVTGAMISASLSASTPYVRGVKTGEGERQGQQFLQFLLTSTRLGETHFVQIR